MADDWIRKQLAGRRTNGQLADALSGTVHTTVTESDGNSEGDVALFVQGFCA